MGRETYYIEIDLNMISEQDVHTFNRRDGSAGAKVKLQMSTLKNKDMMNNTHTVYLYRTKEERESGVPVKYVGKGKILYSNNTPITTNQGPKRVEDDDVPY